jgi:cell division protein FtsB
MGNLTAREKAFMYAITLLIIIVLGYFFGIRTLNDKYDQYKAELQELKERQAYLDMLRANNENMRTEIDDLNEQCSELEMSFIDKLETEVIQQYVLSTFEKAGCPYLVGITSSDVGMATVSYPDGTASPDSLVCMQVVVVYSSTDGYTVTQYNRTPDFTASDEEVAQTLEELMGKFGQDEYAERRGYYEFLEALKKINSDNPQCIKVDTIKVEEGNGAMKLTAAINFYGVVLNNRISVDNRTDPYTSWSGHKNVDTSGGFIGFPYVCDYKDSLWYGLENHNIEEGADKPFAPYWAVAIFNEQLKQAGDLKTLLDFDAKMAAEEAALATPTPAAT